MIVWLAGVVTLLGFWALAFRVLSALSPAAEALAPDAGSRRMYGTVFFLFLAWALAQGLAGLIPVWGYVTGASWTDRFIGNSLWGVAGLVLGWPAIGRAAVFFKGIKIFPLGRGEWFLTGFMALIVLFYLYRVTLPWSDQDEAYYYGYVSKLISAGRTFPDMLREDAAVGFVRSQLVQSWDAVWYHLVDDTYLVRLSRFVNLLFCGIGIFSFLRLCDVRRLWALVAVAGFFSTPELSYLAVSLKVDAVIMMFELGAFLCLAMAFLNWRKPQGDDRRGEGCLALCLTALALSSFAFANRFSGIVSMGLSLGCALFFAGHLRRHRIIVSLTVVLFFCLLMLLTAPGYWMNFLLYGNPVYPTKGFWPFDHGTYVYAIEHWKQWNITGLPPGVLQIYLVGALGVGIEYLVKVLPFLSFLPVAAEPTQSMGWPYPFIFGIVFWLILRGGPKAGNILAAIFIFQFVFWSLGLHYSRIFIASCTLTILLCAVMADGSVPAGRNARAFHQALRIWIIVSLAVSFVFQVWWFQKRFYGPFLFSRQARHEARGFFLQDGKDNFEENILSQRDIRIVEEYLLRREARPVLYAASFPGNLHILFQAKIHVKALAMQDPYATGGKYLLVNPAYLKKAAPGTGTVLKKLFPVPVLTTPDARWELYTVSRRGL